MHINTPALAPSILSADFGNLAQEVRSVIDAGCDIIHFDVMDNHFVPNLTIGPLVLKSLRASQITAPIDVHLMVQDAGRLIDDFADAGASMISFHPNTAQHPEQYCSRIRAHGCRAGLALNPDQPISLLNPYLDSVDYILLMSVFPGFAGQAFIPSVLDKCRALKNMLGNRAVLIEMDGGLGEDTAHACQAAGCDIMVMGSAIFNKRSIDTAGPYHSVVGRIRAQLAR